VSTHVTATAYLQIKPDRRYWGDKAVIGARILKMTQNKPGVLRDDSTLVKVRITVPIEAFEQVPVVDIELPVEALTNVRGVVEPA